MLLSRLDSIPWSRLIHAYGAASDVPGLIRQLLDQNPTQREQALWGLYGNIWHQGTVYEATAYAVPSLIELLPAERAVADRHEILILLAHLATGNSYLDVHRHFTWAKLTEKPDFEEKLALELSCVRAARAAVQEGYPQYQELLADPDPKVRAASAYVLGLFATEFESTSALLRQRFAAGEPDAVVQVALVTLAGPGATQHPEIAEWLRELVRDEACPEPVRIAAALGLVRLPPDEMTPLVRALLAKALTSPPAAVEIFEALPWPDSDLLEYAAAAVSVLNWPSTAEGSSGSGAGVDQETLAGLVSALNDAKPMPSWEIAHSLLSLVFGPTPKDQATPFVELSTAQQFAVRALADSETFWTGSSPKVNLTPVSDVLRAHGLPTRRADLQKFVGGYREEEPSGSASPPSEGRRWWRFW